MRRGKKLKPNTRIISTWDYGPDGCYRWGHLPEGWDGDRTVLIQWDDDASLEWENRDSFSVAPACSTLMKRRSGNECLY